MGVYRTISPTFWTDTKVNDDFSPEDRYFFLYLLTNQYSNICGCYEFPMKSAAVELGYDIETVKKLIDRMEFTYNVIRYNHDTKEVLILNWYKYNWTCSDKLIKGVQKAAILIKTKVFQTYVNQILLAYINGTDTVSIPYPYGRETSVTVSVTVNNTEDNKEEVGNIDPSTEDVNKILQENQASEEIPALADFDYLWNLYPNKTNKQDARKKLTKALDKVSFSFMLEALNKQMQYKQWLKDNGKFCPEWPMLSTWLNKERWNDEVDIPTQTGTEKKIFDHDDLHYLAAAKLNESVLKRYQTMTPQSEDGLQAWAYEFFLCEHEDRHTIKEISKVLKYSQTDPFWRDKILDARMFRKKYPQLLAGMTESERRNM